MPRQPNLPKIPPKPKANKEIKEAATTSYEPTSALIYRQEFERAIKFVDERITNTNFVMGVIIVVLFIGFLTLLFSLIGIFGQYIGLRTNYDLQIINILNELKFELEQASASASLLLK